MKERYPIGSIPVGGIITILNTHQPVTGGDVGQWS